MSVATRSAVPVRKFSNNPLIAFYQSSIGKKLIVAVTALILILYVLGHLLGNLQIYIGQDRMTATWRAHKRGALFADPCFTQITSSTVAPIPMRRLIFKNS